MADPFANADQLFAVFKQEGGGGSAKRKEPSSSAATTTTAVAPTLAASADETDDAAGSGMAPALFLPKQLRGSVSLTAAAKRAKPNAAAADRQNPQQNPQQTSPPEGPKERVCVHEVAIPEQWTPPPAPAEDAPPDPRGTLDAPRRPAGTAPAKEYPFTLDPFQETSIACIERRESVLVSAHTSAGKTVVAEYAIALALREQQRVIYTSPIKALSNQKFRELQQEFTDVGLMTGDITINPHATCLVMTTEILRSMLYRGGEIVREVAWVIFDEIHYLRNRERGVVWEETIIMLPTNVRMVFLSATIPNAFEFAQWIAQTHSQPCHVVYTDMRPVPLQHYIFPAGGQGLHLVVDEKGNFRDDNFQRALAGLTAEARAVQQALDRGSGKRPKRRGPGANAPDCERIVRMVMERSYQPVIVFAFSKKETEALAMQMSKLDFTSEKEKTCVAEIFRNAIGSLSNSDQQLPQIVNMLPLLLHGIGIHHSGLLPILKEVIEILFQEGYVKVLFATETFSMGLNMPAKTVIFTNVRKFDGDSFRNVTPGEYIQMSGRAGRRGLDDRGIVILMVDEQLEPATIKSMVWGDADPLNSAFYVSYSMLLNLLRVDMQGAMACDPDSLVARSFRQFQARRSLPQLRAQIAKADAERAAIVIGDEQTASDLYYLRNTLADVRSRVRQITTQPINILPFLQPGRIVRIDGYGLGAVVNFHKKTIPGSTRSDQPTMVYIVEVVVEALESNPNAVVVASQQQQQQEAATKKNKKQKQQQPAQPEQPAKTPQLLPVGLEMIGSLSTMRVKMPHDIRSKESLQTVVASIRELERRYPGNKLGTLDPINDMHIEDEGLRKLLRQEEKLSSALENDKRFKDPAVEEAYSLLVRRLELDMAVRDLKRQERDAARDIVLSTELRSMKRVLHRLGYTNQDGVIETKGRVAAELNAGDEIVLTELIFSGLFNDMLPEHIAAVLSCFVMEEKSKSDNKPPQKTLLEAFRRVQETARNVAVVWRECKLDVDVEEYVQKFTPAIMDVIVSWCQGATFADLLKMTDVFEGSLIRMMRRLEELLKELGSAAKAIGNSELENKFSQAITKLHRDIVFANSLYL